MNMLAGIWRKTLTVLLVLCLTAGTLPAALAMGQEWADGIYMEEDSAFQGETTIPDVEAPKGALPQESVTPDTLVRDAMFRGVLIVVGSLAATGAAIHVVWKREEDKIG